MFKKIIQLSVILTLSLSISACGNRPSHISPAPNADRSAYPITYPNPATDPSL